MTWFPEVTDFDLYSDGRLQDAVASYGFGMTVNLFGLDLNWDFAKLTDLNHSGTSYETFFWIGRRF